MALTDAQKLEMISRIVGIQTENQNDEDGDKYLSDAYLAMGAIEDVLDGQSSSAMIRQFLGGAS
jgi:hypothetical protein